MNNSVATLGESPLQVVANKLKIGKAERRFAEGKWWLVAPLTTIPADGILNGSKGPGFYPSAETMASVKAWDGMPLTSYHPMDEMGRHTSAGAPGVLDRQGIGIIRDSVWKNKLQHKGWFDEERTKKVNPTIYTNLKNGIPIETSTGLYTDSPAAPQGSNHRGRPYTWTAKNYRPDHVAVLVGQVGACSLNDGCGVLVNVAGNPATATQGLVVNQSVQVAHWVENACECGGSCGKCKPSLNSLTINPFVSESQRQACYAADDPDWNCDEWNDATPKGKKLPERLGGSRPSVENLLGSLGDLRTRPSLLQVLNYDPNEARDESGKWTYTGAAGDRGKTLHKHSQAAHDAVTGLAADEGMKKYLAGALSTSEAATRESSTGNHASASKYHLAAATQLNQAANVVGRNSFWNNATLGLVGRKGDKAAADKIREAATKHMYAGGESGGSAGFGEANKLTEDSHEASKTADKHKVAWLHHAAVNAHLKASQAWKDEADKQGDEGLKKVLGNIAADHQKQAWEHGKSASQAEVGGSIKAAPKGADAKKYEFLKPSTNQLGLRPSLLEVENFNPFHDIKGKFTFAGGAIGAGIGAAIGRTYGTLKEKTWARKVPIAYGASYAARGRNRGRDIGEAVGGTVGGTVVALPTLAGGVAGTMAGLASKGWSNAKPMLSRLGTGSLQAGKLAGSAVLGTSRVAGGVVQGIGKGLGAVGKVSSATLLHGLAGGLEALKSKPSPYSPSVAPANPSKRGVFGAGPWGKEYHGAIGSKTATSVHAFSLAAQSAATSSSLNFDVIGKDGRAGSDLTQLAYREAQLGNHGSAAEKHVKAAELLQKAADRLKTWLPSTDQGKQAVILEGVARKNRLAAIMQGNNPVTEEARHHSLRALAAARSAEKEDTAHKHANAARANHAAKDAWEKMVGSEHNPRYKSTYESLAQHHADLVAFHNKTALERIS